MSSNIKFASNFLSATSTSHVVYTTLVHRGPLVGVATVSMQSNTTGSTFNLGANMCEVNEYVTPKSIKTLVAKFET